MFVIFVIYVCHIMFFYLFQVWYDRKLTWNPSDYGNIASLTLPADKIWTPDVLLFNRFKNLLLFTVVVSNILLWQYYKRHNIIMEN